MIDGFSFKLLVDATEFGAYSRQGIVENVKVPKKIRFHSLRESMKKPAANHPSQALETPDLRFFGRSEQLHLAYCALYAWHEKHKAYPDGFNEEGI